MEAEIKALVLSGGTGTRLRPLTHALPKQLIPIANRPLLEYVLDSVRELGVSDVALVVGDSADQVAEVVGDGSRLDLRVTYVNQRRPLGLAHAVLLAGHVLGADDFVMYLGDTFLPGGSAAVAAEFRRHRPAAQLLVRRVADPSRFGVVECDDRGRLRRIVEKPTAPSSDLAVVGVYFFTAAVHEAVAAITPSARGELEISDAIQWLVDHGHDARATVHKGEWYDAGNVADVLACNRVALAAQRPLVAGFVDGESTVRGPVVLAPTARVVRSTVEGPANIGPGSVVEDSYIGRDTAIGRNCVLRDCSIADSIVLDDAHITSFIGLRRSVIGRHSRLSRRRAGIPPGVILGDHSVLDI